MTQRWFDDTRSDLPASLVVFLVAVPLCPGIALSNGYDVRKDVQQRAANPGTHLQAGAA